MTDSAGFAFGFTFTTRKFCLELPPSVTVDSKNYDIYNIFKEAGIEFVRSPDDQVITTVFDDNEFSDGELENCMNQFSSRKHSQSGLFSRNASLYACLLMVNGISTRGPALLGVMFDSDKREDTAVCEVPEIDAPFPTTECRRIT